MNIQLAKRTVSTLRDILSAAGVTASENEAHRNLTSAIDEWLSMAHGVPPHLPRLPQGYEYIGCCYRRDERLRVDGVLATWGTFHEWCPVDISSLFVRDGDESHYAAPTGSGIRIPEPEPEPEVVVPPEPETLPTFGTPDRISRALLPMERPIEPDVVAVGSDGLIYEPLAEVPSCITDPVPEGFTYVGAGPLRHSSMESYDLCGINVVHPTDRWLDHANCIGRVPGWHYCVRNGSQLARALGVVGRPADVPAPPDGFVYVGTSATVDRAPDHNPADFASYSGAFSRCCGWEDGAWGGLRNTHYAARRSLLDSGRVTVAQ